MENLIIIRYSTNDSSWMSVYATEKVAIKHTKENVAIHFGDKSTKIQRAIAKAIKAKDSCFECDEFNVEIEYGENVYTV